MPEGADGLGTGTPSMAQSYEQYSCLRKVRRGFIFFSEKSKTWIHVKNRPVAPPAQEVVGLPEGTDELRTLYQC